MSANKPPLYDPAKTYLENAEYGPFFDGEIPEREESEKIDFLGFSINSPIGVPAGPLLNSRWIKLASELGYDVLTYKTIRCHEHQSHPLPNIAFVETNGQLDPGALPPFLNRKNGFETLENLAITNSFGNPSRSPEYLKKDIPKALESIKKGQLLIVSIYGTPEEFIQTAKFAKECGAPVVEANFSCPNISKSEGSLFTNPDAVFSISNKLVQTLGDTPLVIKVGVFPNKIQLRAVLIAAARSGVRAVSGINTISMKVNPPLDQNRETCGICGSPIRLAALDFIRTAKAIIDEEKLDLELIATGGATTPEHLQEFLDGGAKIAMTATGMMWDPYIASCYHNQSKDLCTKN